MVCCSKALTYWYLGRNFSLWRGFRGGGPGGGKGRAKWKGGNNRLGIGHLDVVEGNFYFTTPVGWGREGGRSSVIVSYSRGG